MIPAGVDKNGKVKGFEIMNIIEAEKIKCASCKFSGDNKCPLGKSKNLCFPHFVMYLYNNKFTDLELLDIKSMTQWQEIYKKEDSDANLCGAYANTVSSSIINANMTKDKEIILHALADSLLNELIPGSRKNSEEDILKIRKIVPWFNATNNVKKKFKLLSFEKLQKLTTTELFYRKEYIK